MEILEMARKLGQEIQKQECFEKICNARRDNDNDKELQDAIGEFNLIRMSMDKALSDESRNDEKIKQLNSQMKDLYEKIMQNESMIAYNVAKADLDSLMQKITTIISSSANGENPMTVDVDGCTGSCSTCSGCH